MHQSSRGIPKLGEDLTKASKEPLTFADLKAPENGQLPSMFKRLLDVVVARDSKATRSDMQLDHLFDLVLMNLKSDTTDKYDRSKALSLQLSDAVETFSATKMREDFKASRRYDQRFLLRTPTRS